MTKAVVIGLAAGLVLTGRATAAASWRVDGAPNAPPYRLTIEGPLGPNTRWVFDCRADGVDITEVGVTKLMDPSTGKPVGDGDGAIMPDGAALMGLSLLAEGDIHFIPGTAKANPVAGWDLTIRLTKNDPLFVALPKAQQMTLFTTGMTALVRLDNEDRRVLSDFVSGCRNA